MGYVRLRYLDDEITPYRIIDTTSICVYKGVLCVHGCVRVYLCICVCVFDVCA